MAMKRIISKVKMWLVVFWIKAKPYLTDFRLLISFGLAWMITNGWAYLFIAFGSFFKIKWMTIVGSSYVAFLWLPFTPEKLVTIPLSVFIHKILFLNKRRKN